jgi:hypothetical protein
MSALPWGWFEKGTFRRNAPGEAKALDRAIAFGSVGNRRCKSLKMQIQARLVSGGASLAAEKGPRSSDVLR